MPRDEDYTPRSEFPEAREEALRNRMAQELSHTIDAFPALERYRASLWAALARNNEAEDSFGPPRGEVVQINILNSQSYTAILDFEEEFTRVKSILNRAIRAAKEQGAEIPDVSDGLGLPFAAGILIAVGALIAFGIMEIRVHADNAIFLKGKAEALLIEARAKCEAYAAQAAGQIADNPFLPLPSFPTSEEPPPPSESVGTSIQKGAFGIGALLVLGVGLWFILPKLSKARKA